MINFEELKEMAEVLSRNKVKNIQVLGNPENAGTKTEQFYQALIDSRYQSEEDVRSFLYPSGTDAKTFSKLKERLYDKLVNTLFFVDVHQPQFSDIQKAYYQCYKNVAAVKILLGRYAKKSAVTLAEKTIRQALRFEFTDLVLELAKELRTHYGTLEWNEKKFTRYNQLVKDQTEIYAAELEAEEYYNILAAPYAHSNAIRAEMEERGKLYCDRISQLAQRFYSYRLSLFSFLVLGLKHEINNDFFNLLDLCRDALNFFESKKHISSTAVKFHFQIKMAPVFIQLKQYKEAEQTCHKCLQFAPSGSTNWHITKYYHIILNFHSGQFQEAYEVYRQSISQADFKRVLPIVSERWHLFEAFLYYFAELGKIDPGQPNVLRKFRVSRFLNEVPEYSKDKRGTNIFIIIVQVLIQLQRRQYGAIIDQMDGLEQYIHRHLRHDETFRSNCFLKMLLILPKAQFHKEAVRRKAAPYLEKLRSVPLHQTRQSVDFEIIPFETLWEFVLESLDNRFH